MTPCVFIGDEVSAAGFRLAGIEAHVPTNAQTTPLFEKLLGEAQLIAITAEIAARLPAALLADSLSARYPLLLVIPDVRGYSTPPDLGSRLRSQLGMAE